MSRIIDPPNSVKLELTEGCNLRCSFCGIGTVQKDRKKYKFMAPDLAEKVARETVGWNQRWEFAMHGEPTMNPHIFDIYAVIRKWHPASSMMMLTNGIPMLPDAAGFVQNLWDSGLNTVAIDAYESTGAPDKIRKSLSDAGISWHEYPEEPGPNPHQRTKWHEKNVCFVQDISTATKGTHSSISNQAGAAGPLTDKFNDRRCGRPYRELAVRQDGRIAICCNDWPGEMIVGDVSKENTRAVWTSEDYEAIRRILYVDKRTFRPCQGCDSQSPRPGILPDRMGKQTMTIQPGDYERVKSIYTKLLP